MSERSYLTTSDITAATGEPGWTVRTALDDLERLGMPVLRAGRYRLLPCEQFERVRGYLEERRKARNLLSRKLAPSSAEPACVG